MVDEKKYPILAIGRCAIEILKNNTRASIIGVTSKGTFARTESDRILFLTPQPYRGPLTINLPLGSMPMETMAQGGTLRLSPGSVFVDHENARLEISQDTCIYEPFNPHDIPFNHQETQARIASLNAVLSKKMNWTLTLEAQKLSEITNFFQNKTVSKIVAYLSGFLGLGAGLTPSGDDFICGVFLALSIWGVELFPGFPAHRVFDQVQKLAFQKTTSLSANLIACAARGAADERIINTLFWLCTGEGNQVQIIEELLTYGSSSGLDTLRGITAAVT